MNMRWMTAGVLGLAAVSLLAVNIASQAALRSARVDLTDNHLYTLSQGTKNILAGLSEPITLRLFVSQKLATRMPGISSYVSRVRELLDEYQRRSGGHLHVVVVDPEPFSEEEDQAVGYGLQGVPIGDGASTFYCGLVASGPTDEEAVIPFLSVDRAEFLEYDLTKLIHEVNHPHHEVVGLISGLPMDGGGPQARFAGHPASRPWVVLQQMRQLFTVRTLEPQIDAVPKDIDILMLVQPKGLSDAALYAVDQYVLGGGHALIFVDPLAESDPAAPQADPPAAIDPGFARLLGAWGVEVVPDKTVGDLQLASRVTWGGGPRSETIDYPLWMTLASQQLDGDDIVTADLGSVVVATPGALRPRDKATTTFTPLFQTTAQAMAFPTAEIRFQVDPQQLLRHYQPGGSPFTLAARISGKAASAFPDGPPADQKKDAQGEGNSGDPGDGTGHLAESKEPIDLIVVADTDLLADRFWVREQNLLGTRIAIPRAANGTFVINALDNLAGSNDLISVRNRGQFSRPFTRVDELREAAEVRYRQKEQELVSRLQATEHKLADLERGKQGGNEMILDAAQQQELERFRQEKVELRKELRGVRHDLRREIEHLETAAKFVNIGLMPLLIAVGGVAVGVQRVRRRRAAAVAA